jgi:hypothetical protein
LSQFVLYPYEPSQFQPMYACIIFHQLFHLQTYTLLTLCGRTL